MAYAETQEVADRLLRSLTVAEDTAAAAFLDDIEAQILSRFPTILESTDPVRLRILVAVEAAAVVRVLRNPEGLRQWQESIDDHSRSGTVDSAGSTGALYLTDAEWASLRPAGTQSDAFTITPSYSPLTDSLPLLPYSYGQHLDWT